MKKIIDVPTTSEDVNTFIYKAADVACKVLDEKFPGYENGGINSQIMYSIQREIERLLIQHNLIKSGN